MFDTGNILYCKDFQFNNSQPSKDKYFIVLKRDDNKVIIGSLPTRTNKIPSFITIPHGCINIDERCFNCYLFQENKSICDNGFCFEMNTFVYGDEIDSYSVETIEKNYKLNETYKVEGKLSTHEYDALIDCITNSNSVKKGFQKILLKK